MVAINRAVAIAESRTAPQAGLAALDALAGDTRLADYQPYWAARAGLLAQLGDAQEAAPPMSARSAWSATRRCGRFLQERKAGLVH